MKKLVLSRKGFDSANGGIASPILPDGRLLSLPIPSDNDAHAIQDLRCDGVDVSQLVCDLIGKDWRGRKVHLDPDLTRDFVERPGHWHPAFGQTGAAQGHLMKHGLGVGDVFLFYGWFRQVAVTNGRYRFARGAPDLHVIFGWLQVENGWRLDRSRTELLARYPGLENHPHLANKTDYPESPGSLNTLYVGADRLTLDGMPEIACKGAGRFATASPARTLTKPGCTRRIWRLPKWMARRRLTYHQSDSAWTLHDDHAELRSACIGQEFVLDCAGCPEATEWVHEMLREQ